MNTVVPISREDERLDAASRWVLKIDEGPLSERDKAALDAWLDASQRNRDVLLEVAAVWDKTDALSRLADFFPHEVSAEPVRLGIRRPRWVQHFASAIVVVLIVVFAVQLPRFESIPDGARTAPSRSGEYQTAIGERKTVVLPDGTEVVLNTDSRLSVYLTATARVLHLARGEILVRVAKDSSRPLSVVAGNKIVQATGTEFTVEITDEQLVEVLVTEGRVVVGIQPKAVMMADANVAIADAFNLSTVIAQQAENTLSAGEELTLGAADTMKKIVTPDEIEVRLAWKEGRLIFRSEPLETALREVARYTTIEFVLLDERLKSEVVSGIFQTGDVEALLVSLEANFNITHKFDGENRVLLSSL